MFSECANALRTYIRRPPATFQLIRMLWIELLVSAHAWHTVFQSKQRCMCAERDTVELGSAKEAPYIFAKLAGPTNNAQAVQTARTPRSLVPIQN